MRELGRRLGDDPDPLAYAELLGELYPGPQIDEPTVMPTPPPRLDTWIAKTVQAAVPQLTSFATGLNKDREAVIAGLTTSWSSGRVEGTVNKIKMLKRQMFGRANTDLLRKRILLAI
jgi:Transposase